CACGVYFHCAVCGEEASGASNQHHFVLSALRVWFDPAAGDGTRLGFKGTSGDGDMKVGITCYPSYGGSGVVAPELGKELASRGHEVHFLSYALPIRLTMTNP